MMRIRIASSGEAKKAFKGSMPNRLAMNSSEWDKSRMGSATITGSSARRRTRLEARQ